MCGCSWALAGVGMGTTVPHKRVTVSPSKCVAVMANARRVNIPVRRICGATPYEHGVRAVGITAIRTRVLRAAMQKKARGCWARVVVSSLLDEKHRDPGAQAQRRNRVLDSAERGCEGPWNLGARWWKTTHALWNWTPGSAPTTSPYGLWTAKPRSRSLTPVPTRQRLQ